MIAVLGVFSILLACKKDKEPSEIAVHLGKLSDTWTLVTATKDDREMSGYENFKLTLSGSTAAEHFTYAVQGRPELSPWLAGGTWIFGSTPSLQILRDPKKAHELFIYYSITETTLTLNFIFSGEGYENNGRVESAEGHWTFTFSKQ